VADENGIPLAEVVRRLLWALVEDFERTEKFCS
jgi:hypothetical protein